MMQARGGLSETRLLYGNYFHTLNGLSGAQNVEPLIDINGAKLFKLMRMALIFRNKFRGGYLILHERPQWDLLNSPLFALIEHVHILIPRIYNRHRKYTPYFL